jgi:hypothetical protein
MAGRAEIYTRFRCKFSQVYPNQAALIHITDLEGGGTSHSKFTISSAAFCYSVCFAQKTEIACLHASVHPKDEMQKS